MTGVQTCALPICFPVTIIKKTVEEDSIEAKRLFSEKLDAFFLHRTWGSLIMGVVLFLLFQSVFWVAEYPMTAIEEGMGALTGYLSHLLPKTWYADLLINGVLAGLGGILVFVPQIMILFGLILQEQLMPVIEVNYK